MKAILFGIANYEKCGILKNPANDANDLAAKLDLFGFNIKRIIDCTQKDAQIALAEFEKSIADSDVALFYFAGHGFQVKGENFLAVSDTDPATEIAAKFSAIPMNQILELMDAASVTTKIIILDACRDNPWARSWGRDLATRGLAAVHAPKGTIICYATSPGETASDGTGRNGIYTQAILKHIEEQDCSIEEMFKKVRNSVAAISNGEQTTWEHTSLSGNFYFKMSIGTLSGEYDPSVFSDKTYRPLVGSYCERILAGLKSYNWYRQNPVIDGLDSTILQQMNQNELLVIGRNIYQAACGMASSATDFIEYFQRRTEGWPPEKTKSILDGMLLEIFYDSKGGLRKTIKNGWFAEVYEIVQNDRFVDSRNFINWCLHQSGKKLISEFGSVKKVPITVTIENSYLQSVYFSGSNIIKLFPRSEGGVDRTYCKISFETELCVNLATPIEQLEITYIPNEPDDRLVTFYSTEWEMNFV